MEDWRATPRPPHGLWLEPLPSFLREQREVRARRDKGTAALGHTHSRGASFESKQYDAFIAYAYEDKETVAHPLAELLGKSIAVWYDDFALKVGDSLRRS